MESLQLPLQMSLNEVESLIRQLYCPTDASLVLGVERQLQSLQKSQQGWQLADALMHSKDEQIKFFGALTFTIKINTDL